MVFDWGGTLAVHADIDVEPLWGPAAEVLEPGDPARQAELHRVLAQVEAETWARVRVDQSATTLERILAEACRRTATKPRTQAVLAAAAAHLDAWTPHLRHDPACSEVLQALRAQGLRIGLLSNTHWPRVFHEHLLERDGLLKHFDATCVTSELPRTKPHPMAFKAVLHLLDVADARRVVFVGDRAYDDIYGARSLGMYTVRRSNKALDPADVPSDLVYAQHRPDAVVDELAELLPLVAGWS